jgi:hypothetical protein
VQTVISGHTRFGAGSNVPGVDCVISPKPDVGIRQHDHVVPRSDQGRDTLAVRHRNLLDVASHRSRPDEGDRLDNRVIEKPVVGL